MSTKAEAVLEQFQNLPPMEQRVVLEKLGQWLKAKPENAVATDPIRSARGMFAGSGLTEALLASRAEERRRG